MVVCEPLDGREVVVLRTARLGERGTVELSHSRAGRPPARPAADDDGHGDRFGRVGRADPARAGRRLSFAARKRDARFHDHGMPRGRQTESR